MKKQRNPKKTVWLETASGDILMNGNLNSIEMIGDKKHPPYLVVEVDGKQAWIGKDPRRLRKLKKLCEQALEWQ